MIGIAAMRPIYCVLRKSGASLSGTDEAGLFYNTKRKDSAPVGFAKLDNVVERFATYRSDQPLDMAVLPNRARCGRLISISSLRECGGCRPNRTYRRRRESGAAALCPRERDLQSIRQSDCSSR
jgi:hypothetical protein